MVKEKDTFALVFDRGFAFWADPNEKGRGSRVEGRGSWYYFYIQYNTVQYMYAYTVRIEKVDT